MFHKLPSFLCCALNISKKLSVVCCVDTRLKISSSQITRKRYKLTQLPLHVRPAKSVEIPSDLDNQSVKGFTCILSIFDTLRVSLSLSPHTGHLPSVTLFDQGSVLERQGGAKQSQEPAATAAFSPSAAFPIGCMTTE